jgi:hypothetical protein
MQKYIFLCLCLGYTFSVLAQEQAPPKPQTTEIQNRVFEDYAYQFTLTLPLHRWQILDQKQSKKISPLAIVGATQSETQMAGFVLVEKVAQTPLEQYVQAIFELSPLKDIQIDEVLELDFQGQKALQVSYSGDSQGRRFRYLNIISMRQGFAYQVVAGGPSAWVDYATLKEFTSAIKFTEGKITENDFKTEITDQSALTWEVKDQIFSSIYGFSIQTPEKWRLLVGKELSALNTQAEVGLFLNEPQTTVLISTAPCPIKNELLCAAHFKNELQQNLSLSEGKPAFDLLLKGQKIAVSAYDHTHFKYFYGVIVEKGQALQFLAWGLISQGDQSMAYLKVLPDFMKPLNTAQNSALKSRLYDQRKSQDFIQAESALINGVYRHFQHQIQFQLPAGIWKAELLNGEQARGWEIGKNQSAILHINAVGFDFDAYLISEQINCHSQEDYHQKAWNQLASRLSLSLQKQGKGKLIEAESLWTELLKKKGDLELFYRLHTVCENGIGIQVLTTSPLPLYAIPLRMQVESGLSFQRQNAYISIENNSYVDHRFMFEINDIDLTKQKIDLKQLDFKVGALSTSVFIKEDQQILSMMAMSNLQNSDSKQDFSQLSNIIIDQLSQKFLGDPPQSSEIFIQGKKAKKIFWARDSVSQQLILIVDAPILYAILTQGPINSSFHQKATQIIKLGQ